MAAQVSDTAASQAVFQAVTDGTYPEDEQVVSAELSSLAVNSLSELLEKAREEVKTSIRELSRLSASDIDGWIVQARQLRDDIEGSEKQSAEIVELAENGALYNDKVHDAQEKVALLKREVTFNESLFSTLEEIQGTKHIVDNAQGAVIAGKLDEGIELLQQSRQRQSELRGLENTRLTGLIDAKLKDLDATLAEAATKHWRLLVVTDFNTSSVTINQIVDGVSLETVANVLEGLDLLKGKVIGLKKDLEAAIILPRLRVHPNGQTATISATGDSIQLSDQKSMLSVDKLLSDLESTIGFLDASLPKNIAHALAEILMPTLVSRLLSGPLSSSVPPDLSGLISFESSLTRVKAFASFLKSKDWPGSLEIEKWANNAPNVWLARRSDSSLHSVRQLLIRGLGRPRTVERVETRTVAREDDVFQEPGESDNWNASWSDDGQEQQEDPPQLPDRKNESNDNEDDDDAWGWNDDGAEDADKIQEKSSKEPTPQDKKADDDEDEGDAWGWGDDEEKEASPVSPKKPQSPKNARKDQPPPPPAEREVTLRESYWISSLPEQIMEIAVQAVDDADSLARLDNSSNSITPAATGLYKLPNLILSMYRASAPAFYARDPNGNMYLYNDCLYLAEQLRTFANHHQSRSNEELEETGLDHEITSLETYGKGAYRKEMESQRTIIGDLLDNAQEFRNCTEEPFLTQCEIAISSTIDRLREVNAQFKEVLSPSALLQSTGSLLSTVTNKMILYIEDMSDISAPESQKLAEFCRRLVELQDLFVAEDVEDKAQGGIAAAVYTSTWWKFQYLAEVLESSLADIKYLWTEGELSLEFEPAEIIDLIEALFAESEHRRNAINEIKRSARG